ncbi:MAG: hypothetical protein ACYS8L_11535, partial [Planctomycetota bacterium]
MSTRATQRAAFAAVSLLLCWTVPCSARSKFVERDHDYEILRLEGRSRVVTWEQKGVRVFIATKGAMIRQGRVRLTAPSMVVWFDKALSARPGVRAARVRVYAEGIQGPAGRGRRPVRLVEGRKVRECGAILMEFTSTMSFVWDCPLNRSQTPVPSSLFATAEARTKGL